MDVDPALYRPEATERLDLELVEATKVVIDTDERQALHNLFDLLSGWAEHLKVGMVAVGFEEYEAGLQSWQVVWNRYRRLLDEETNLTTEVAAYIERNLGFAVPDTKTTAGEPLDPLIRTFYRTFVDRIEHPAIHPTAAWLFETS